MLDEKIDIQLDSICDAGQKGWSLDKFSSDDIKKMESCMGQIIEEK